jgi:hypothetical protein
MRAVARGLTAAHVPHSLALRSGQRDKVNRFEQYGNKGHVAMGPGVVSRPSSACPMRKRSGTGRSGTLLLSETLVSARAQMTQSGDRDGSSQPLPSRGCTCSLTSWRLVGSQSWKLDLLEGVSDR